MTQAHEQDGSSRDKATLFKRIWTASKRPSAPNLKDRVLPVYFSLVILGDDLNFSFQLFNFGHSLDFSPLVVYLDVVDVRIALLFRLHS